MITEWLAGIAFDLAVAIAGMFPEWEIPAWVYDQRGSMITMIESFQGLGVWVDWNVLGICLIATASAFGIGLLIRVIRALIAHVPQFGGGGA